MNVCDNCGKIGAEGETFFIFVDPGAEWWLSLMEGPMYCEKCAEAHRQGENNDGRD